MVGYIYADGASAAAPTEIGLVVLDKDGCLLDFNPTWLPELRECAHRTAAEAASLRSSRRCSRRGWIEDEAGARIARDGLMHAPLEEITTWLTRSR